MTEWRLQAACRGMDPNLFMPDQRSRYHPDALTACTRCPVTTQCLEDALQIRPISEDQGWRAGTTQNDRRRIRRQRNRKTAAA